MKMDKIIWMDTDAQIVENFWRHTKIEGEEYFESSIVTNNAINRINRLLNMR